MHHREPPRVTLRDQLAQALRAAVRRVRRRTDRRRRSPSRGARELRDRHQLDVRDAERDQVIEVRDRAVERATARECPDVELVDDASCKRHGVEAGVPSRARSGRSRPDGPCTPSGCQRRARIGPRWSPIDADCITAAVLDRRPFPPTAVACHSAHLAPVDHEVDAVRTWCPDAKRPLHIRTSDANDVPDLRERDAGYRRWHVQSGSVSSMNRLAYVTFALAACAACGDDGPTPMVDTLPDPCAPEMTFTGEFVDWDSTEAAFHGVLGAKFALRSDPSKMSTTAPNGRFMMCIPAADGFVDVTPTAGSGYVGGTVVVIKSVIPRARCRAIEASR